MPRPSPSLVLALVCATSCPAWPQQQSVPQSVASSEANRDADISDCSEQPALARRAPIDNSSGPPKALGGEIAKRLIEAFNSQSRAVNSIDANVQVVPMPGPSYGDQAQYSHEIDAILFAARPGSIRLLAQAPFIGRTLFDLASDGDKFQIAVPSRHEFLIGRYGDTGHSSQPLENIRPQHLLDALIWPALSDDEAVRLSSPSREDGSSYNLVVSRKGAAGPQSERAISFDGKTLRVQRMEIYGAEGNLVSEIHFEQWMNVSADAGGNKDVCSPRHISIRRPAEDYRLEIQVTRIGVNAELGRERFHLAIAPGMRPVNLDAGDPKPSP